MTEESNRWVVETQYNRQTFKSRMTYLSSSLILYLIFLSLPMYIVGFGLTVFINFDVFYEIIAGGGSAQEILSELVYLFINNEALLYSAQIMGSLLSAAAAIMFFKSKFKFIETNAGFPPVRAGFNLRQFPHQNNRRTAVCFLFICLGATRGIEILINLILTFLEESGITEETVTSITFPESAAGILFYFMAVVIAAPLTEEYFFRGVLFNELSGHGVKFAVVFSSAMFGIMHRSFYIFFFAFIFGIFSCVLYVKTNSLKYPIIAHMIINGISFTKEVLYHHTLNFYYYFEYISFTVLFAAAVISSIILIRRSENFNLGTKNRFYITKKSKLTYTFNPAFALFLTMLFSEPLLAFILTRISAAAYIYGG